MNYLDFNGVEVNLKSAKLALGIIQRCFEEAKEELNTNLGEKSLNPKEKGTLEEILAPFLRDLLTVANTAIQCHEIGSRLESGGKKKQWWRFW